MGFSAEIYIDCDRCGSHNLDFGFYHDELDIICVDCGNSEILTSCELVDTILYENYKQHDFCEDCGCYEFNFYEIEGKKKRECANCRKWEWI